MEKQLLDKFIRKYNLNGNIEAVKWSIDASKKTLNVAAKSEDRNTVVYVELAEFDGIADTVEFGVYETKKLRQLMGVFDTQFNVSVNKKGDEVRSLDLSNDNMEVRFVASSLSVVSSTPAAKDTPEFEVEIMIDETLADRYNKAKSALNGADTFTLMNDKKGDLKLVLGYSSNNTDRITMDVQTIDGKKTLQSPLHFQANVFKEVLSANSECDRAVLRVSERGLANITFDKDNFRSNYFMVAIPDVD